MIPCRRWRCVPTAVLVLTLALMPSTPGEADGQDLPRTAAERADWERTSTHAEVLDFIHEVQAQTDQMLIQELTVTNQGRSHPVVFLGDPPLAEPTAMLRSGKPTLFIVSSIHGNEPSGREGGQQFIRELTLGEHRHLLEDVNVIIVPNMNADGGDVPQRRNSLGYDMNRDWIVAETREVSAVVEQILNRFAPDVFVDAHNGGSYPYQLTYQATLDPTADDALVEYARGPMYEHIERHLDERDMRFFWYSGPSYDDDADEWFWRTTVPWPRKQHSYGGIRNMITLLYEVPGRNPLDVGADAAREGMLALTEFMAQNASEVRQVVEDARRRTVQEPADEIYFDLEPHPYPEREEFYVMWGEDGEQLDEPRRVEGENRTLYRPGRTRSMPYGYAFDARLDDVAAFLRRHSIQVERLQQEVEVPVERYRIQEISWDDEPYQNNHLVDIRVELVRDEVTLPKGAYVVRNRQHEGRLVPQLMEPDAVDSVVRWGFLDHSIPTSGGEESFVPIYRLEGPVGAPTHLLP